MLVIADNDILSVLAQADLIEETLELFQLKLDEVVVTTSFKSQMKNQKRVLKLAKNEVAANRLQSAVAEMTPLPFAVDEALLLRLNGANLGPEQSTDCIDPGEAQLIAAAVGHADSRLASGDKKALRVIQQHQGLNDVRAALCGRIVCVESLVLGLINTHGFGPVHQKIASALKNGLLRGQVLAYGFQSHHDEKNARECLDSYLRDLNASQLLASFGQEKLSKLDGHAKTSDAIAEKAVNF